MKQAKAAAGKSVGVHGADTIRQILNAGLFDEISVDIAAVLLGSGVRLFDNLAGTPFSPGGEFCLDETFTHTASATRL